MCPQQSLASFAPVKPHRQQLRDQLPKALLACYHRVGWGVASLHQRRFSLCTLQSDLVQVTGMYSRAA
jgi:hypothetical protein